MAGMEERVARVEAHNEALIASVDDLRADLRAFRGEVHELRTEMNRRFDMMDQKFVWLVGTQIATLLAVVGVLAGALYR